MNKWEKITLCSHQKPLPLFAVLSHVEVEINLSMLPEHAITMCIIFSNSKK